MGPSLERQSRNMEDKQEFEGWRCPSLRLYLLHKLRTTNNFHLDFPENCVITQEISLAFLYAAVLTVSRAAARVRAAPAADVAAAGMRTTLTPTNPNQQQE